MHKITKNEKKLLKAAKKLEKATKKYMESITKVDKILQKVPTNLSRRYLLEEKYFRIIPTVARAAVKFELLYTYLQSEIENDNKWVDSDPDYYLWDGYDTDLL